MNDIINIAELVICVSEAFAIIWLVFGKIRKIVEGQRCNLRSDMLRIYYKCLDERTIRQYELENFLFCYEAYKALGGNSFIDKIHEEVLEWKVVL